MARLLVIDDDRTVALLVQRTFEKEGHEILSADDGPNGLAVVRDQRPDVILLDIMLPRVSGLAVFQDIQAIDRRVPVIFITAGNDSETAIDAMRLGGFDYVVKPLDIRKLGVLIDNALETRRLMSGTVAISAVEGVTSADAFIGKSDQMVEVFKEIGKVANQDVTVLIRGESGTGKELVARALYHHSRRADAPFMAVNCAAIPDQLLESELFGHEKGAFTGADRTRIGKFEQCSGGTIFLDEVGDMAPLVQGKVLRLLQEQRFERVGGNETIRTNVRIITATNRDLDQMVADNEFRADLFYRLNGVTIHLPPLRERQGDVESLIRFFFTRMRVDLQRDDVEGFSPEAVKILKEYKWPGNVRELQSVVRRSLLHTTATVVGPANLPPEVRGERISANGSKGPDDSDSGLSEFIRKHLCEAENDLYSKTLEFMERELITRVLKFTEGNQSRASEVLGITRGKIRDRIATFGIRLDRNVELDP